MDEKIINELINGAVDMHIHGSPDVVDRKMSDIGIVRAAKAANLAGVLLKCHYVPTTSRAALASECADQIAVFGGIVLNRPVGGLNPDAVETELKLGAKQVWLPTISAINDIQYHQGNASKAVNITDENGKLAAPLYEIFELIAQKNVILGTGHISWQESEKVVEAAQAAGVKKIVITHPEWEVVNMPVEVQTRLAARGVFFERCFYASNSPQKLPPVEIANQIKKVGVASTILSSDFGQTFNEEPVAGFKRYLSTMMEFGLKPAELEIMIKDNPKTLLDMQ